MAIEKNYKQILLSRLILNPENDRFEPVINEREAIEMMLQKLGTKIYNLAYDIVKRGLSKKPFYVIPSDDGKKYIVKDGNRRTTALKLVAHPQLIDKNKYPEYRKRFERLHKLFINKPIKSVLCYVYLDSNEADQWVELEHTGEQKGVGVVSWIPEQIQRFNTRRGKKIKIEMQALNFIRNSSFASSDIKEKTSTISLTNFQRILSDAFIRERLGLKWVNSMLLSDYPENEVAKGLCCIINEIAKPDFSVKSIYTVKDRMQFIERISSSLPEFSDKSSKVDIWELSYEDNDYFNNEANEDTSINNVQINLDNNDNKEVGKKAIPINRKNVIPAKCLIRITNPKVNKIYKELQTLDINKYTNCASIVLRVFVELSIDTYLETFQLLGEQTISAANSGRSLHDKVSIVRSNMTSRKVMDDATSKGIRVMTKKEDSLWSIKTFHAYVHNNIFAPTPTDITTAWDNIEKFMVILWHEIEQQLINK
ncbi:MAG: hypothetical protein SOX26_01540 [Phocaeicola sp.]|nr:hypothetical protein [Phocaeicola sp.]